MGEKELGPSNISIGMMIADCCSSDHRCVDKEATVIIVSSATTHTLL
jgi:hypothetical protein